jgi:hypothetical protein
MGWIGRNWKTVVGLLLATLTLIAAWLVVPEFRRSVGLDGTAPRAGKLNIAGIVVDRDTNRGIGQASIMLVGRTEQYVTEDSGNFTIDLPPDSPKRVRLRVSKDGFQPFDTSVEPPVGELVLSLKRQQ